MSHYEITSLRKLIILDRSFKYFFPSVCNIELLSSMTEHLKHFETYLNVNASKMYRSNVYEHTSALYIPLCTLINVHAYMFKRHRLKIRLRRSRNGLPEFFPRERIDSQYIFAYRLAFMAFKNIFTYRSRRWRNIYF